MNQLPHKTMKFKVTNNIEGAEHITTYKAGKDKNDVKTYVIA